MTRVEWVCDVAIYTDELTLRRGRWSIAVEGAGVYERHLSDTVEHFIGATQVSEGTWDAVAQEILRRAEEGGGYHRKPVEAPVYGDNVGYGGALDG